ncbi:PREDICTED: gastrula zinc finger protein XlCGF8.2DB-like, partial [Dinoponera quadriceps]|uniref:Gastrula zinc finger protein XlCGF8.2DB-like n=1 Tax=Dinoponera quadriceps TaxID=609295 RepID=A0A6P3XVX3_DINQU
LPLPSGSQCLRDIFITEISLLSVTWYPLPTSFQLYPCDTCGRQYRSKISLQRHKRLECGKEAQFSCILCHAKFKHKHSLLRHYNVHIADMKITNTFENADRST